MRILPSTTKSSVPTLDKSVTPLQQSVLPFIQQTNARLVETLGLDRLSPEIRQQALTIYHLLRLMMKTTEDLTPFKTGDFSPNDIKKKLSPLMKQRLSPEACSASDLRNLVKQAMQDAQKNRLFETPAPASPQTCRV